MDSARVAGEAQKTATAAEPLPTWEVDGISHMSAPGSRLGSPWATCYATAVESTSRATHQGRCALFWARFTNATRAPGEFCAVSATQLVNAARPRFRLERLTRRIFSRVFALNEVGHEATRAFACLCSR